ncbi:hypothetical protein Rfer_2731 [Rhodoferax ferrireducens T118]|uniref:DUF4148 domain-containing protein n=1 Tax=Albidiferax ferrireducens (strain ATCC BAA-621 / DSM 15236 / T118) TaxID=338969 RepID=Q21UV9_ALBFT|nr:hypothetical protein [Rhodoferax ferrireducens]ABD70444.1 hypothetical protein Rfer_2731 [Rhodoferax ferrireducens T118]
MKHSHFFFLFLSAAAVGAWAQSAAPRREEASMQLQPDLRRSELREALKRSQTLQAQESSPLVDAEALEPRGIYDRRLSAQERADLREQLRQQSFDGLLNVTSK